MSDHHDPEIGADGFEKLAHPVSVKFMVGILGALLFLTFLTVGVSYFDIGRSGNLFVALFIATAKASIVALFFMHLRWDKPFNAVILIASFAFLLLFIAFVVLDSGEYQHELIPMDKPYQTDQFELPG